MSAAFPDGHFYSPVVDTVELAKNKSIIWPEQTPVIIGVDFCEDNQISFIEHDLSKHIVDFNYPVNECDISNRYDFFQNNTQFEGLDSRALFSILKKYKPSNMIEVGSGFSSLLTADVNRNYLKSKINFQCIEPYPRDFLLDGVPGISTLLQEKVEDLPISFFDSLESGDILFIDSSHVAKTGSDVNYLYFEIIPRLKPGVIIHIHDIFLPYDYPESWVLEENRSWNEQYILRAMLMFTDMFEVIFGSAYAYYCLPNLVKASCNDHLYGGGSFWFVKNN